MKIQSLKLVNFKNYSSSELKFTSKVNLFYGLNGSGKTNLLDALFYLAISKSNFTVSDKDIVKEGSDFFRLEGSLGDDEDVEDRLVIKYRQGQKKEILLNGIQKTNAAEIIGAFPVVFVAPDDIRIVRDDSRYRRSFVDRLLCQCDPNYLRILIKHNRVLRQKKALLKSSYPERLVLDGLNATLKECALEIFNTRTTFIELFAPRVQSVYDMLSGGQEEVELHYVSQLKNEGLDGYSRLLEEELRMRRPLYGVQKDDLQFMVRGKSLKKFGSQGQVKSFLYALRLAEFDHLKLKTGKVPFLILDDFFEKLDNLRLSQLIKRLSNHTFDQVFLSDTELERSQKIFSSAQIDFSSFEIQDGSINRQKD